MPANVQKKSWNLEITINSKQLRVTTISEMLKSLGDRITNGKELKLQGRRFDPPESTELNQEARMRLPAKKSGSKGIKQ